MARGQVAPVPVVFEFLEVDSPRLARLVSEAERETLGGHGPVTGHERRLVLRARRAQPQSVPRRHRARLARPPRRAHLSFSRRTAPFPHETAIDSAYIDH